jgi:single-strand DNA-binding protein
VQLLGHLGQDAETKLTPSSVACTSFSVATNRRWKDQQSGEYKEATDWHRCVLWRSENVSQYLLKGKQIFCEGRLQTRQWDDKGITRYTTEVVLDNLLLLGGGDQAKPAASGQPRPAPRQQTPAQEAPPDVQGITDDDVPF